MPVRLATVEVTLDHIRNDLYELDAPKQTTKRFMHKLKGATPQKLAGVHESLMKAKNSPRTACREIGALLATL